MAGGVTVSPVRESSKPDSKILMIMAFGMLGVGVYTFWQELVEAQHDWETQSDYSHGYLVIPIAAYLLWDRWDRVKDIPVRPSLFGFLPLLFAIGLRFFGSYFFYEPLNQAAVIIWIAGVVWLLGGLQILAWAAPVIFFLVFMFPMPFRLETMASQPLQQFATMMSCWLLQLLGQPAFAVGNVINLNGYKLEVVDACSGLRMVVGFLALCVAYAILTRRSLWEKVLIVLSALPIAVICNVLRITITGILSQRLSVDWANRFMHDLAGWLMMPMGLVILMAGLWYMDRLFVESEVAESTILTRPRP
jgi:exosortase